jgi:transposase-like protein
MRKGKKYGPSQMVNLLRDVGIEVAAGRSVEDGCRTAGISPATYYKWRNRYAGLTPEEARTMEEIRRENARLKRLVADQALDNQILREALRGKD